MYRASQIGVMARTVVAAALRYGAGSCAIKLSGMLNNPVRFGSRQNSPKEKRAAMILEGQLRSETPDSQELESRGIMSMRAWRAPIC